MNYHVHLSRTSWWNWWFYFQIKYDNRTIWCQQYLLRVQFHESNSYDCSFCSPKVNFISCCLCVFLQLELGVDCWYRLKSRNMGENFQERSTVWSSSMGSRDQLIGGETTRMQGKGSLPLNVALATLFASFGCVSFGYAISWSSPAIPSLSADASMPNLSDNQISWISVCK